MLIKQTGTYGDPPAMVTIPAPNIINTYTDNIYCTVLSPNQLKYILKLIYSQIKIFKKILIILI